MNMIALLIGAISVFLGLISVTLTFVTFFSPDIIKDIAISNPRKWRRVPSAKSETTVYRHKVFSGFSIEVDMSEPVCDNFHQPWMDVLVRHDLLSKSYRVILYFNGVALEEVLFIEFDGGRNFIPAPMIERAGNSFYIKFSTQQRQVADIVGRDYFSRSFCEVFEEIERSKFNPWFQRLDTDNLRIRMISLEKKLEQFKFKRHFFDKGR